MRIGFVMESEGILRFGHSVLESDKSEEWIVEAISIRKQKTLQCLKVSDCFNAKGYSLIIEIIKAKVLDVVSPMGV